MKRAGRTSSGAIYTASEARKCFAQLLNAAAQGAHPIIRRPGKPDIVLSRSASVADRNGRPLGIDDHRTGLAFDLADVTSNEVADDFSPYL